MQETQRLSGWWSWARMISSPVLAQHQAPISLGLALILGKFSCGTALKTKNFSHIEGMLAEWALLPGIQIISLLADLEINRSWLEMSEAILTRWLDLKGIGKKYVGWNGHLINSSWLQEEMTIGWIFGVCIQPHLQQVYLGILLLLKHLLGRLTSMGCSFQAEELQIEQ